MLQHVGIDAGIGRYDLRAKIRHCFDRMLERCPHVTRDGGVAEIRTETDAQAVEPSSPRGERAALDRQAAWITHVISGDDLEQEGCVANRAGDRAGMGQRGP